MIKHTAPIQLQQNIKIRIVPHPVTADAFNVPDSDKVYFFQSHTPHAQRAFVDALHRFEIPTDLKQQHQSCE